MQSSIRRFVLVVGVAAMLAMSSEGQASPQTNAWFGHATAVGDFNCDGYDDLAVGSPYFDVTVGGAGVVPSAGRVVIYKGTSTGLTYWQKWSQASTNIVGSSETADRFGSALAAGDFDGSIGCNVGDDDCRRCKDDLAIGVNGEDGGQGYVQIIYSNGSALNSAGNEGFHLSSIGSSRFPNQTNARFGLTLASTDFNGDLRDDLAVGAPFYDLWDTGSGAQGYYSAGSTAYANVGLVAILWSNPASNLDASYAPSTSSLRVFVPGCSVIHDDLSYCEATTPPIRSSSEYVGWALAGGAVTSASFPVYSPFFRRVANDLFIGAPGRLPEPSGSASGSVLQVGASAAGTTETNRVGLGASVVELDDVLSFPLAGDEVGCALAVGNLHRTFYVDQGDGSVNPADLVVGACGRSSSAGAVVIGDPQGGPLDTWSFSELNQDTNTSDSEFVEAGDHFGGWMSYSDTSPSKSSSLATGYHNRDGYEDLIIGVAYESVEGTEPSNGAVNVVYSTPSGFDETVPLQVWSESGTALLGDAEPYDYFGWSVASGFFRAQRVLNDCDAPNAYCPECSEQDQDSCVGTPIPGLITCNHATNNECGTRACDLTTNFCELPRMGLSVGVIGEDGTLTNQGKLQEIKGGVYGAELVSAGDLQHFEP